MSTPTSTAAALARKITDVKALAEYIKDTLKETSLNQRIILLQDLLLAESIADRVWLERAPKAGESSFITGLSYNNYGHILSVRIGKTSYVFLGVPSEIANELINSPSWGTAFNTLIKGKYASYPR